ncbi:hypothetical protein CAPTEDRAFT_186395 [Capitella teleta]|uniref:Uncharacterized protein n=1 Tax=Capitella teleta TaxID=283909 RepID=R7UEV0_CAPTE|nr:hypothetical protein CAPTEDRAFT_186395 [Capitella teleta]|eukprot:ELU05044.1 hypothetical protein CAPTEDRAFT_186395 [Capitella teleta]
MEAAMTANSSRKRASYEPPCAPHEPMKRSKSVGSAVCGIPLTPDVHSENHASENPQQLSEVTVEKMETDLEDDFADWTTNQTLVKDLRRRSSFMAGRGDCNSAALQSSVKESMGDLIDNLNADDLETNAVKKQASPKPSDAKTEASIKIMEADLKRYTAESNAWHEALKECKHSADHAASRLKGDLILHDAPKLSPEQQRFLNSRPNYQEKLNNLSLLIEKLAVTVSGKRWVSMIFSLFALNRK